MPLHLQKINYCHITPTFANEIILHLQTHGRYLRCSNVCGTLDKTLFYQNVTLQIISSEIWIYVSEKPQFFKLSHFCRKYRYNKLRTNKRGDIFIFALCFFSVPTKYTSFSRRFYIKWNCNVDTKLFPREADLDAFMEVSNAWAIRYEIILCRTIDNTVSISTLSHGAT